MEQNRRGEAGPVPFRTNRTYVVGDKWYFSCREGDKGPYGSMEEMEGELVRYLYRIGALTGGKPPAQSRKPSE